MVILLEVCYGFLVRILVAEPKNVVILFWVCYELLVKTSVAEPKTRDLPM